VDQRSCEHYVYDWYQLIWDFGLLSYFPVSLAGSEGFWANQAFEQEQILD
jgi:hypothetical protein